MVSFGASVTSRGSNLCVFRPEVEMRMPGLWTWLSAPVGQELVKLRVRGTFSLQSQNTVGIMSQYE